MATEAQIEANRRNALLSTGPKTDAGKTIASKNSVTHGLNAADAVIEGEDVAEFEAFAQELFDDYKPVGVRQRLLVDQIIRDQWKLRRIPRLEAETVKRAKYRNSHTRHHTQAFEAMSADISAYGAMRSELTPLQLHEQRLQRAIRAATRDLKELQKERKQAAAVTAEMLNEAYRHGYNRHIYDRTGEWPKERGPDYLPVENEANSDASAEPAESSDEPVCMPSEPATSSHDGPLAGADGEVA